MLTSTFPRRLSGDRPFSKPVRANFLGQVQVTVFEKTVTQFRSSRAIALLAYLFLNPGECEREVLAESLWPDRERESARQNLRQTLLYVREILGSRHQEILVVSRQTVAVDTNLIESDLDPFIRPWPKSEDYSKTLSHHAHVVASYRGPLLPAFADEWITTARSQVARNYFEALIFLSRDALGHDLERSLGYAETAVVAEPFEDSARAAKILALRKLGRDAAAQREFATYAAFLQSELALQPGKLVTEALTDAVPAAPAILLKDRHDGGTSTIEETLGFLREQGMTREASDLALALVPYWIRRGSPSQGELLLLATLAEAKRPAGDTEKLSLARLAFAQGDGTKARLHAEEVRLAANSQTAVAESSLILARLELRDIKPRIALAFALNALRLARKSRAQLLELDCWIAIMMSHFGRDHFEKVDRTANRIILVADRIGDRASKKLARMYQAYAFHRMGLKERAESILYAEIDNLGPTNSIAATQNLSFMSRLLEELGHPNQAAKLYRTCADDCRSLGNNFTLCVVQTYLADLETVFGNFEESLKLHLEVLKIRRELNQNVGIATSLRGIGKALLGADRPDQAKVALQESAQRFRDDDAPSGHASSQLLLAEAEAKLGNLCLAARLADNSLDILRGLGPHGRLTIGPSGASILQTAEKLSLSIQAEIHRR